MNRLLLVDANSLIFKAFYSTAYQGKIMTTSKGQATNALRGVIQMTLNLIKKRKPTHILFAFDKGKKTFRHQKFPNYKAGRSKTPQELKDQFQLVKDFLNIYQIKWFEILGYEADDIIATISKLKEIKDFEIEIFSSDKDLLQLVNENVKVFLTNKGVSELNEINITNFNRNFKISPHQIVDLKGLMGDSSDNLKGVPGVGPKTALKLLHEFINIENIFQNINQLKGKIKESLVNNKDQSFLCKQLATLYDNVPFDFTVNDLIFNNSLIDNNQFFLFLQKFELNSIIRLLKLKRENQLLIKPLIIKDLPSTFKAKTIAINIEMKSENYNFGEVLGLSISTLKDNYFIDKQHLQKAKHLHKILQQKNIAKITFNSKQLINGLHFYNQIKVNNIIFDFKIASHLLNHQVASEISIIAQHFTKSFEIIKEYEVYGFSKVKTIPPLSEVAEYSCSKSWWMIKSLNKFVSLLKKEKLDKLYYKIEFPLIFILAKMEQRGILINKDVLNSLKKITKQKIAYLTQEIHRISKKTFNIDSPAQLGKVLFEDLKIPSQKKTKKKSPSTSFEVLSSLIKKHEIIKYILLYRKYIKMLTTYINGIEEFIQKDNKIHTIYNQGLTLTGRLSSKFPNLQNISINDEIQKKIRKIFIAEDKKIFLSFDYSQIELRVLADMANCQSLIKSFIDDEDIHLKTASKIFDKEQRYINVNERKQAKTINFGIIYGISDFGLSKELKIPLWEAKNLINSYEKNFPEIKKLKTKIIKKLEQNGFAKTLLERKRYISDIFSNVYIKKQAAIRAAINTPIQGSAAEILKIAMINIEKAILKNNLDANIILQIHDELIIECNEDNYKKCLLIFKKEMESALTFKVPLKVYIWKGKNMFDLK